MSKFKKLNAFYIVLFYLIFQFFINLDPFIFNENFNNIIVVRYFPYTIIFSISLYKSEIFNKNFSKSFKLLLSFFIGIILSIVLSFFNVDWYTYKIILTDLPICLCLYKIIKNKITTKPSIIVTVLFGILYFIILNQATKFDSIINIGEYGTFITNIALISTAVLFVDNSIKNNFFISIIVSIILITIFYLINLIYAINIKSKIDNIDTTYNNLTQAISQRESTEKLKSIINIFPDFPKIGSDNSGSFSLPKPESPYTSIQIVYNYVLLPAFTSAIDTIEETPLQNNKTAYSELQSTVSFYYDNFFGYGAIETMKQFPLEIFTSDFIFNILLIVVIILYKKFKF